VKRNGTWGMKNGGKSFLNYAFLSRAMNYFLEKIHKEGKIAISQLRFLV
jgi:hypothetical protein